MKITRPVMSAVATVVLLASSVGAATITFSTDAVGTGFGGTSLTLNNSLGASSTLTFIPDVNIATGVPSNVNFGNFTLLCAACSTQEIGAGSFFNPFTFDLIVTDVTDGATGKFVGTSTGGTVFSNVSQVTINWSPLVLGPGTTNATTGNFGTTSFSTTAFTGIVAPNSGAVPGQSTVEGYVTSSEVPEPATLSIVGFALVGRGLWRRKDLSR